MKTLTLLLCLISVTSWAGIPPGQYQCYAFDSKERSYTGLGNSILNAMKNAHDTCKRVSGARKCKTAQSFCEQGPLSLIDDRCVVSDRNGRMWNTTGREACRNAISMCNNYQWLNGPMKDCQVKHW